MKILFPLLCTLALPASALTLQVPASGVTLQVPVTVNMPSGCASSATGAKITVTCSSPSPTPTPAPPASSWVYTNGALAWAGDWSFAATADYRDTTGAPISGAYDIKVTGQQWGGWQPYVSDQCNTSTSYCFDTGAYTALIFSLKPTRANQVWSLGVMSAHDTADGPGIADIGAYCSGGVSPPVGQWESCRVPVSAFHLTDPVILKFSIQDQTGATSNVWYADDVGWQ